MLVAVAQMDCQPGDLEANAKTAGELVDRAAEAGAEVVVFPEVADTGYDMDAVAREARPLDGNEYLATLMDRAAAHGMVAISGVAERVGDRIYNSAVATDGPGSVLATYRKVHLHGPDENRVFTPGDEIGQFRLAGMSTGLTVCFDLRFPSLFRTLSRAGTELVVLVAAWPMFRVRHWRTLLAARAIENQCYVVASDRVGRDRDGDFAFAGTSMVVDPYGVVVAEMDELTPGVAVAEVSRARLDHVRTTWPWPSKERLVDLHP